MSFVVVQQRQQMRLGAAVIPGAVRDASQVVAGGTAQVLHGTAVTSRIGQGLGPPPPPYPGPPPPYPGPCQQVISNVQ